MTETSTDLTIRSLDRTDDGALVHLAQRDSATPPTGTVIGAFAQSDELVAAIALETGEAVADPFLPSDHAVDLLRVRARQLGGASREARRRGRSRRRHARAALPASPPGAGGRLLALSGLRPPS